MPWANLPKSKWPAMERCTSDLKKDPNFKPLKGKTKEESAIAVCYSSIMGGKGKGGEKMEKPVTINFYGDYWDKMGKSNGTTITIPYDISEDSDEKGGEIDNTMKKQEEEKVKCPECGKMVAKDKMKAHMVEMHPAKKVDDAEPVEEKPAEAPAEPEKPAEEAPKVETPVEEKVEEKMEKKAAEPEQAQEVTELLKSMIAKIDSLTKKEEKKVEKADDSAPADGTAPEGEEAPKEGEKTKPEGEKPEGESTEGTEEEGEKVEKAENPAVAELAKINSSLSKFDQSLSKIGDQLKSFDERLKKIEEQPAPVKVSSPVVVSKGTEPTQLTDEEEKRLVEIKKQLDDLDYERKHNLDDYQKSSKWNKAFALIDERDRLEVRKKGL